MSANRRRRRHRCDSFVSSRRNQRRAAAAFTPETKGSGGRVTEASLDGTTAFDLGSADRA